MCSADQPRSKAAVRLAWVCGTLTAPTSPRVGLPCYSCQPLRRALPMSACCFPLASFRWKRRLCCACISTPPFTEKGVCFQQRMSHVKPREGCKKGKADVMQLDLGCLDSVRRFTEAFNRTNRRLDLLACNAGIMAPLDRHETVDRLEEQFQVGHTLGLLRGCTAARTLYRGTRKGLRGPWAPHCHCGQYCSPRTCCREERAVAAVPGL